LGLISKGKKSACLVVVCIAVDCLKFCDVSMSLYIYVKIGPLMDISVLRTLSHCGPWSVRSSVTSVLRKRTE